MHSIKTDCTVPSQAGIGTTGRRLVNVLLVNWGVWKNSPDPLVQLAEPVSPVSFLFFKQGQNISFQFDIRHKEKDNLQIAFISIDQWNFLPRNRTILAEPALHSPVVPR